MLCRLRYLRGALQRVTQFPSNKSSVSLLVQNIIHMVLFVNVAHGVNETTSCARKKNLSEHSTGESESVVLHYTGEHRTATPISTKSTYVSCYFAINMSRNIYFNTTYTFRVNGRYVIDVASDLSVCVTCILLMRLSFRELGSESVTVPFGPVPFGFVNDRGYPKSTSASKSNDALICPGLSCAAA